MNYTAKFFLGLVMVLGITSFWGCNPDDDEILIDPVIECDSLAVIISMNMDSMLVATVSGGSDPYTFLWSNGETTDIINLLSAGSYTVTVTDGNDCTVAATFDNGTTVQNCIMNIDSVAILENADDTYTLTATVSSGTEPYTYAWSNGTTGNPTTVNTTGNYFVTVTDAVGCWTDTTVFITPTIIDSCSMYVSIFPDSIGMGQVLSYVYGGTPPYVYNWSDGSTTANISNPVLGTVYSVTITDAYGCEGEDNHTYLGDGSCASFQSYILSYPDSIAMNSTTLIANAYGGQEPYSYIWSEGTTNNHILVPNNSGTYSVTITDQNGCENEEEISL